VAQTAWDCEVRVSLLSVTAAQIIIRFLDTHLVPTSFMLLLCFLMFTGWHGGVEPGLLAIALTFPVLKYYFAIPIHSLTVKAREIPRLLIVSLALISSSVVAQTAETPRTIHVVMDNAYAPYSFQSDEGKLQGILIDQWQAWEKKTGIKAEIHSMDWDGALRRMRVGEFDVIDSIVETAERRDYFDFTPGRHSRCVDLFSQRHFRHIRPPVVERISGRSQGWRPAC
jgi:hypothetical protein